MLFSCIVCVIISSSNINLYFYFGEMSFSRYKLIVQVVLGEQRGAGVKMGARCMWDSDADSYASVEYENVRY